MNTGVFSGEWRASGPVLTKRSPIDGSVLARVRQANSADYERVVELAMDNIAILPPKWANDFFGNVAPFPVIDRFWLILALGMLGRFTEAISYEAELIQLAEPTRHATTIGLAFFAGGFLRLVKGDWAREHSLLERDVEVTRAGNVGLLLPQAVAMSAWVLAQLGDISEAVDRLQEGRGHR